MMLFWQDMSSVPGLAGRGSNDSEKEESRERISSQTRNHRAIGLAAAGLAFPLGQIDTFHSRWLASCRQCAGRDVWDREIEQSFVSMPAIFRNLSLSLFSLSSFFVSPFLSIMPISLIYSLRSFVRSQRHPFLSSHHGCSRSVGSTSRTKLR